MFVFTALCFVYLVVHARERRGPVVAVEEACFYGCCWWSMVGGNLCCERVMGWAVPMRVCMFVGACMYTHNTGYAPWISFMALLEGVADRE